jgi:hypothetical protein
MSQKQYKSLKKRFFLPGSGNNAARAAIFTQLEQVLVTTRSRHDRLAAAQTGLEQVELLEKQIVAAKNSQHKLEGTVRILERTIPPHPRDAREAAEYTLSLLNTYNDASQEALSYLTYMNNETRTIFTQIIDADGELSDEYITKLNDEIPEAETCL